MENTFSVCRNVLLDSRLLFPEPDIRLDKGLGYSNSRPIGGLKLLGIYRNPVGNMIFKFHLRNGFALDLFTIFDITGKKFIIM